MKGGNGAVKMQSFQKMTKVGENLHKLSKIGFVLGLFLIVHSSCRNSHLIKRLPKLTRVYPAHAHLWHRPPGAKCCVKVGKVQHYRTLAQ